MILFHWLRGKEHFSWLPYLKIEWPQRGSLCIWGLDARWLWFQFTLASPAVGEEMINHFNSYGKDTQ